MSKSKKNTKKKSTAKVNIRKDGEVDLRTLPVDKRPKPTTGQSREEFALELDALSAGEAKVIKALNGTGKGVREVLPVASIAKASKLTALQVRNSIRRLVPSGWVERVDEILADDGEVKTVLGHYRLHERGRRRLAS